MDVYRRAYAGAARLDRRPRLSSWPGRHLPGRRWPGSVLSSMTGRWPGHAAGALAGLLRPESGGGPAFCRRHSYRGGKTPAQLLERLHAAPAAPVGLPAATLRVIAGAHVDHLRALQAVITDAGRQISDKVHSHPRAQLLRQLPGAGVINLAQLLAEVGPIPGRVDTAEQAAVECGAAPVTRASGKTKGVYFRWAANTRARKAITSFAHNARLQSPWAGKLYADARTRGKHNPHAVRIVARAWLRVIWACWQSGEPYDPDRHQHPLQPAA
jgi:Transposase IS116/IS110/IS902 family